jgi:hypothetical protein
MHPLLANLRQFYQRWVLLLVWGAIVVVTILIAAEALFDPRAHEGKFAGLLIPIWPLGLLVAVTQMEVLSKPFSFCLPGHHAVLRKLVLVVGLATSFVFSLPFLGYPGLFDMAAAWWGLVLCAVFCANLLVYMAGLVTGLTVKNGVAWIGFLPALALFALMVHLDVAVERAITHTPYVVIALAGVAVSVGWRWLGRPAWFRRRCGRYWTELFTPWDRARMERYRQVYAARRFTKNVSPALDGFFQRAIARRGLSDRRRYVWGALYLTCVLMVPQWTGLVCLVLLAAVWSGFAPSVAPFVIGVVPLMMAGLLQPPLGTTLLVAGGRRERFFATAALMLGLGAASVLVVGVAIALTHLLAPLVPAFEWKGIVLHLQPVCPALLLVPLVVFPVVTLMNILFRRRPVWLLVSLMLVFVVVSFCAALLGRLGATQPGLSAVGILLSWSICLAAVRRIALHRDLVTR